MSRTYPALEAAIAATPVIDTHDHLRAIDDFPRPMTLARLLRFTYLSRSLRPSDGSPNGLPGGSSLLTEEAWRSWLGDDNPAGLIDTLNKVRLSSYFHWLWAGLADLYGLKSRSLGVGDIVQLDRCLADAYSHESWLAEVLDKCHVDSVLWDPNWKEGLWQVPERRFRPSLRINSSLVSYNEEASDFEGCNLVRDWGPYFDLSARSLADIESLIERVMDKNLAAGARSVKLAFAYDRTLDVGRVSRNSAKMALGKSQRTVSSAAKVAFEDYIVRFYLDRCSELGLVAQVHTGLGRLGGSNPLLLIPLLEAYPGVTFDLFHGGYPWMHEVGALAQNYPNVRLNLVWLPQLSTHAAVTTLTEWIQVVPQTRRISWGADCTTVEEMCGGLLAARWVIGRALSSLVDDDYIDLDVAIRASRDILYDGAAETYGLTHTGSEPPTVSATSAEQAHGGTP